MLNDSQVTSFIPVTDLDRARPFYTETLVLTMKFENASFMMLNAHGMPLRVVKVGSFTPQPFTIVGWDVADIAAESRGLAAAGIVFERYPWFDQDAAGIWTSPSGARVAWFKDPDGNLLSITQVP